VALAVQVAVEHLTEARLDHMVVVREYPDKVLRVGAQTK
jgi:hypothetical protein